MEAMSVCLTDSNEFWLANVGQHMFDLVTCRHLLLDLVWYSWCGTHGVVLMVWYLWCGTHGVVPASCC
jgi:hypothetical protein